MKSQTGTLAFVIAGVTTVLCWLLFILYFHNPASQAFFGLGNLLVGVGCLLIVLAMSTLRRAGDPQAADDFTSTTVVVTRGVYGLVRHPLYLGWMLMYPAAMLVSQHWLVVLVGAIGILSIDRITRVEDHDLVEKFGADYEAYRQDVPRLNILLGIARKLRRWA